MPHNKPKIWQSYATHVNLNKCGKWGFWKKVDFWKSEESEDLPLKREESEDLTHP